MVEKKMTDALDEGKLIVLNLGPGDFTPTGHYLVVTGYTEDGFTLNDPNSRERSAMTWTFERLENQVKNLWAIGK
jgi:predicted double-glycine peptidase